MTRSIQHHWNTGVQCRHVAAALVAGIALFCSPSYADVVTHAVDGATRIHFKLPGELAVRPGAQEKLTVEAPANVISKLDIAVKGGTLVLGSKGSFKSDKPIKLTLTLKSFRSLKSEGSGNVEVGGFSGNDFDVEGAGSGNIALKDIRPVRLVLRVLGSNELAVSGSGNVLVARIDGSGTIDAVNFRAKVVDAGIAGSGDIRVHAEQSLKAEISGAGNIAYQGKAKVTQSVTGAGSVDRL